MLFHEKLIAYYYALYRGDMTQLQVRALDYIILCGGVRQQDLAERLDIPKQHAAKLTAALLSRGFIKKAADPEDSRAVVLTPSAEGLAHNKKYIDMSYDYFFSAQEGLSPEESERLREALSVISALAPKFAPKSRAAGT